MDASRQPPTKQALPSSLPHSVTAMEPPSSYPTPPSHTSALSLPLGTIPPVPEPRQKFHNSLGNYLPPAAASTPTSTYGKDLGVVPDGPPDQPLATHTIQLIQNSREPLKRGTRPALENHPPCATMIIELGDLHIYYFIYPSYPLHLSPITSHPTPHAAKYSPYPRIPNFFSSGIINLINP